MDDVGLVVGDVVASVGDVLGLMVGDAVGAVGRAVGDALGLALGRAVGDALGLALGLALAHAGNGGKTRLQLPSSSERARKWATAVATSLRSVQCPPPSSATSEVKYI